MENIKDKIENQLKTTGTISAETLAGSTPVEEVKKSNELNKPSVVTLTDKIKNDPMIKTGETGDPGREVTTDLVKTAETLNLNEKLLTVMPDNPDQIVITPEEKDAYIAAIINNTRFCLPFKFLNDRFNVVIRSKTQVESYAIFYLINYELNSHALDTQLAYSVRLRNMLFAAQVAEINGVKFTELKEPLLRTVDGEKEILPGWLDQIDIWKDKSDALLTVLFNAIKLFEYKYLTLTSKAGDQNFWKTGSSI